MEGWGCKPMVPHPSRNWLSHRQHIVVNGVSSQWEEVRSGVQQGSVLGPILFILYVNDLPDCVSSSQIAMFAANTKCFPPIRTCSDVVFLQNDLDALSAWALHKELSFQPAKCENLQVTSKRNSPPRACTLNGVTLKRVVCSWPRGPGNLWSFQGKKDACIP